MHVSDVTVLTKNDNSVVEDGQSQWSAKPVRICADCQFEACMSLYTSILNIFCTSASKKWLSKNYSRVNKILVKK